MSMKRNKECKREREKDRPCPNPALGADEVRGQFAA
jgi:hypothetical protein